MFTDDTRATLSNLMAALLPSLEVDSSTPPSRPSGEMYPVLEWNSAELFEDFKESHHKLEICNREGYRVDEVLE